MTTTVLVLPILLKVTTTVAAIIIMAGVREVRDEWALDLDLRHDLCQDLPDGYCDDEPYPDRIASL